MAWVAPQIPQILMINYFWLNQLFLMIGKNQKKVIRWEPAGIYIYYINDFQMKKYCETTVNPYKTP